MYKLLLCWRYLKTRYLAMACIISVMLGVATLIVVNSVMSGFSTKLRERLHALLSDVVIESQGMEGFSDPKEKMARIMADPYLGPRIEAMSGTMEVFAMLQYRWPNGEPVTRPVKVIGVDPKQRGVMGGFREYVWNRYERIEPSFELSTERREEFEKHERFLLALEQEQPEEPRPPGDPPPPKAPPSPIKISEGAIVGNLIASFRKDVAPGKVEEVYLLNPGESIILTTVSGQRMTPVNDRFEITGYFKSEMSEYDANHVFVSLDYLQKLRTMDDRVTHLLIKLRDYNRDAEGVSIALTKLFEGEHLMVNTWEKKQGPLLQAIDIEKGILNVLLFLIIAVAGFGILAIFSMIVTEKTRDIGILKALGASNGGVMKIFLGYGLLLGAVGAGLGSALGCWLTIHINEVEGFLSRITGTNVFDRKIYYFDQIPTDLQPFMVVLVNVGAIGIAVLFSVLPALRAAFLHPVRALRYE
ncbi:MAG: ABC transporter permease [Planctomycetes bacterium]|nr:ABC transporter permease [Planctomycetota bacterium]